MLANSLMEDKQLDYNQPILSVRRFTSTVTSEKNEKPQINKSVRSIRPLPHYGSELKSGPISKPGTVPFVWEKFPGRPKCETESPCSSHAQPPVVPKLPPGRIVNAKRQDLDRVSEDPVPKRSEAGRLCSNSKGISSVDEVMTKLKTSKDAIEEEESSDSGDNDETYHDALDTLSRTESLFLDCSLSGVSGLDGPEVKSSGTFSMDPQTREFMMSRFLPAAKAMTCDASQSAYRKPSVSIEQPQHLKDVIRGDRISPDIRCRPYLGPTYTDGYGEEESEDEDNEDDETGNVSTKVCGLLPRFCLLSPVPGVSIRTRLPSSAVSKRQVRSSSAASIQEIKEEGTGLATQEQRSIDRTQKPELHGYNHSTSSKLNQIPYQVNDQKLNGNSLYRRLQGNIISLHENKLPLSRFYKKEDVAVTENFNSEKRCEDAFQELSGHPRAGRQMASASAMVEKTLYVDSVHKVVSPETKSVSYDQQELLNSTDNDKEVSQVIGFESMNLVDSLCKDAEDPKIREENVTCQHKSEDDCDTKLLSANLEESSNNLVDSEDQKVPTKVESTGRSAERDLQFLNPPPLPKSPTESWLWRTLPAVSSKYSTSHSYLGSKINFQNQGKRAPSNDFKWETIVKTTNMRSQHARISEELSPPASKT